MKRVSLALFALGLFACQGAFEAALAQESWKKEWEKTVEGARSEGEVAIYGPHNPLYRLLWAVFQKSYPEIKFTYVPGKGSDHAQRILAERRAGKFFVDIVMGGSSTYASYPPETLEPLRPHLILPEVADESGWWEKKLWFADPQGRSAIVISGEVGTRRGSYNTQLLDPKEIQSWWDLLNPKWKGRLGSFDPRVSGGGGETFLFFYYTLALGPKFITRLLTEMDVAITRDLQQGTDWLAKGKILFYLGSGQPIMRAKQQGLPVDLLPHPLKEGEIMGGGSCCMALLHQAPHPNAARVFLNWVLSRGGQISWQKFAETNSLRIDIPKDDLPPAFVPKKGVTYFMLNSSQYHNPAHIKAMHKIVDEALKKAAR